MEKAEGEGMQGRREGKRKRLKDTIGLSASSGENMSLTAFLIRGEKR
jgi:hypothetical protein